MTAYRIPAPLKLRVFREPTTLKQHIEARLVGRFTQRLDQLEALLDETRHELDRTRQQLRSLRIVACLYMLAATWLAFFGRFR